jgi:hypothetical protein
MYKKKTWEGSMEEREEKRYVFGDVLKLMKKITSTMYTNRIPCIMDDWVPDDALSVVLIRCADCPCSMI